MFEMAENLLSGKHVSRDPLRAVHLLKKASSGGHSVATWTLGQLLITGYDGVQQDVDMGREYVAAALNAEPTIAKKVFVPYTESQLQAPISATTQPAHHATLVTEAAAKAQKPTSLLRSRWPLYAATIVGVALVAAFMSSRMRRK
jgi:TPR repeat protein